VEKINFFANRFIDFAVWNENRVEAEGKNLQVMLSYCDFSLY
jgi:hypothetical protein